MGKYNTKKKTKTAQKKKNMDPKDPRLGGLRSLMGITTNEGMDEMRMHPLRIAVVALLAKLCTCQLGLCK